MIKISDYSVTTPLAKPNSKVARTFQPGEDLSPVAAYIGQGMCFAPTTGAATQSVHRTRAEIVGKPFYFKDAESHLSQMTWHLAGLNWAGKAVFQQMHCDDGNDPTLKLFIISADGGKTGRIDYGLRTTDGSADPRNRTLLDHVDFTKAVTTSIRVSADGVVSISAAQNGSAGSIEEKLSAKRAKRPHVFHWGVYNQVNMGDIREPAGDGTLLYWSDITELHSNAQTPTLAEKIDAVYNDWKASKLEAHDALLAFNILSKEVAKVPDSSERSPLYNAIKAYKSEIA